MTTPDAGPLWTTAQTAARLQVRPESLYAYVSRGLIRRARYEGGRSWFDPLDVEEFAVRRDRVAGAPRQGKPLMVLDWPHTEITESELRYRGRSAAELATTATFEETVEFFWDSGESPASVAAQYRWNAAGTDRLRRVLAAAGNGATFAERMTLALVPARADEGAQTRFRVGREVIARLVAGVEADAAARAGDAPIARRILTALSGAPASTSGAALVDAALILSIDHDLAASTFAARVAASAGAGTFPAVRSALGAFAGARHGAASAEAHRLLEAAMRGSPERALSDQLARTGSIPAFGHPLYGASDPRAVVLLRLLTARAESEQVIGVVERLCGIVAERLGKGPNFDLALAALAVASGIPADAAPAIFATGRSVGWLAHIWDEHRYPALRLRPQSRYTGTQTSR